MRDYVRAPETGPRQDLGADRGRTVGDSMERWRLRRLITSRKGQFRWRTSGKKIRTSCAMRIARSSNRATLTSPLL